MSNSQIVDSSLGNYASDGGMVKYADGTVLHLSEDEDRVQVSLLGSWVWQFYYRPEGWKGVGAEETIKITVMDKEGDITKVFIMSPYVAKHFILGLARTLTYAHGDEHG